MDIKDMLDYVYENETTIKKKYLNEEKFYIDTVINPSLINAEI